MIPFNKAASGKGAIALFFQNRNTPARRVLSSGVRHHQTGTMIRTFLIATCMFAPFLTTGESIRTNMPLTDGELRRKVVGVWTADGLCLHGVMTNTADGRSLSKQWADGTNCNVGLTSFIESAWRIENGIMIERVTKSSNADITAVGRIFRTKIIRVDDDVLVSVPLGIGVTVTNVVRRLK